MSRLGPRGGLGLSRQQVRCQLGEIRQITFETHYSAKSW